MDYVLVPNLPQGPVKLAVADGRISAGTENGLRRIGVELIKTKKHPGVYEAVSWHPDIMIHHLGSNRIIYAPGTHIDFLNELQWYGFELIQGTSLLTERYPGDIPYNVARVGDIAIHNFTHTDPGLKGMLSKENLRLIHVKQGYSKCAISIVSEKSIITADAGIAKAVSLFDMDVLLIKPGDNIALPGIGKGFIGGCSSLLDRNVWAVSGNIRSLESYELIRDFLYKNGMEIISLSDDPVTDIGSIIPLAVR